MLKPLALVLLLSITLALTAQQYSSKVLGKVTMPNGADLTVAVDSAGTVILSTPAHSMYVDRPTAMNLENSLEAILAGMKDLEAKDISVVDYRMIGRLINGGSQDASQDSIMFRLELNTTKNDKVLLSMYSTRNLEDMLFTTTAVAQLDDLVNKALKSVVEYGDQYAYIQSVIDKIDSKGFK